MTDEIHLQSLHAFSIDHRHDLFQNIQGMESGHWMWLPKEDHMPDINPEERVLTPDPLPLSLRLYINTEQFFSIYYSDTEFMYTITETSTFQGSELSFMANISYF